MNSDLSKAIGKRINTLLAEKERKQKELAAYLGVQDNTISYFVSGRRTPNTEQLVKIADFFNVSADYLLGRTNAETTDRDLRFVCEYTGLSENTVTTLSELHDPMNVLNVVPGDIVPLVDFLINDMRFQLTGNGCAYRRSSILPRLSDYLGCASYDSEQEVFIAPDGKLYESREKALEETKNLSLNIIKIYRANAADLTDAALYKRLTDAIERAKERYRGDPNGND